MVLSGFYNIFFISLCTSLKAPEKMKIPLPSRNGFQAINQFINALPEGFFDLSYSTVTYGSVSFQFVCSKKTALCNDFLNEVSMQTTFAGITETQKILFNKLLATTSGICQSYFHIWTPTPSFLTSAHNRIENKLSYLISFYCTNNGLNYFI